MLRNSVAHRTSHIARPVYGPFHRRLAPGVQDANTALLQLRTGEIWGKTARYGSSPAVKAYPGPLDQDQLGIEFWAFTPPDTAHGPRRFWRMPSGYLTVDEADDCAILKVAFVRVTQDLAKTYT